jgi:hypothetical protein
MGDIAILGRRLTWDPQTDTSLWLRAALIAVSFQGSREILLVKVGEVGAGVGHDGAGDALASGFLCGYLCGQPVSCSVHFGAVAGVHACTVAANEVRQIDRATLLVRS